MRIKSMVKALAAGVALAATTSMAQAAPINIGGVIFDPSSPFDFQSKGDLFENILSAPGQALSGFGRITNINQNLDPNSFCPNCELTYTFGGFVLQNTNPNALVFTGGWVNFYVQDRNDPNFTAYDATAGGANPGNAGDGALWLALQAQTDTRPGWGTGTLFGSLSSGTIGGSASVVGNGGGLFDVTGGLAGGVLDTNTYTSNTGANADILLSSEFQPTQPGAVGAGAPPLSGSATFSGNAQVQVPEPATLALLGAGLFGIGFTGKRRKSA